MSQAHRTEQLELCEINQKSACAPHTSISPVTGLLVTASEKSFGLACLISRIILSRLCPCAIFLFVAQVEIVWERNGRVCGKVKGWQAERPHPRLFGTVPLSHCAHGTRLPLEAFQESDCTLGTGGQPIPRAHLPQTALFSTLPHF